MIATAALIYVRKAATTNSALNSAKFPVNLTPVLFSGRGDPVKKNAATPTFREFQVIQFLKKTISSHLLFPKMNTFGLYLV